MPKVSRLHQWRRCSKSEVIDQIAVNDRLHFRYLTRRYARVHSISPTEWHIETILDRACRTNRVTQWRERQRASKCTDSVSASRNNATGSGDKLIRKNAGATMPPSKVAVSRSYPRCGHEISDAAVLRRYSIGVREL